MTIHDYLDPVESGDQSIISGSSFISKHITYFRNNSLFPSNKKYDVALLGLPDSEDVKTFEAANQIRQNLYQLVSLSGSLKIIDLGNVKPGHSINDTCFAISEIISEINSYNMLIVLIGGVSKFNLGSFMASDKRQLPTNMVSVDSVIQKAEIPPIAASANNISHSAELFNFSNIAYQGYYVEPETLDYLNDSYFEAYRLGVVRTDIKEMEPVLRDANMISFSLNAIKFADAPGAKVSSPNGLTGEEACQLAFFAGHSPQIKTFGLFDLDTNNDFRTVTAKLAAQIIWYLLEGVANAIYEEPGISTENFTKYLIHNNLTDQTIAFYKSNVTNRWWMEITFTQTKRSILLSCSETDYEMACHQDIPHRWWRTYQRILQ
jgi:formiminoglutamase